MPVQCTAGTREYACLAHRSGNVRQSAARASVSERHDGRGAGGAAAVRQVTGRMQGRGGQVRERAGHDALPMAGVIDSQSVKADAVVAAGPRSSTAASWSTDASGTSWSTPSTHCWRDGHRCGCGRSRRCPHPAGTGGCRLPSPGPGLGRRVAAPPLLPFLLSRGQLGLNTAGLLTQAIDPTPSNQLVLFQ